MSAKTKLQKNSIGIDVILNLERLLPHDLTSCNIVQQHVTNYLNLTDRDCEFTSGS